MDGHWRSLLRCGVVSPIDVICCEPKQTSKRSKIPLSSILELQSSLYTGLQSLYIGADVLLKSLEENASLLFTGKESFDKLTDGLQSGQVLVVFGPSMTGKTTCASLICIDALCKNTAVFWVNIGCQLNLQFISQGITEKLETAADANGVSDFEECLKLLSIFEVAMADELLAILELVLDQGVSNLQSGLLIIDSLSVILQLFSNWCVESRLFLGSLREVLMRVRRKYSCAIVMVFWEFNNLEQNFSVVRKSLMSELVDCQIFMKAIDTPVLINGGI